MVRCDRCGSNRWRKAPGGMRVCEEGHVDMNYRRETNEQDGAPSQMAVRIRRTRTEGKQKGLRKLKGQGREEVYYGQEADFLHWELVQLLIRCQIKALQKLWKLPSEFELIARDLLSLCLLLYPLPPLPEKLRPSSPEATQSQLPNTTASQPSKLSQSVTRPPSSPPTSKTAENKGKGRAEMSDEEEEEEQEEVRKLEEAHQSDDSTSDSEDDEDDEGVEGLKHDGGEGEQGGTKGSRSQPTGPKRMEAIDCLSVVVLACWTMRIPVMFNDFVDLINTYALPYLNFINSSEIPPDMRKHFNKHIYGQFRADFAPTISKLYAQTSSLALKLSLNFGIQIPELNASPVIWHCIRSLGLSPIFYPAILSLSQKLDIHLSLHHSLSPNYASSSLSQPPSLALDEDESESDHLTSSSCSSSSTEAEEDDELLPEAGGKKNQAPKLRGAEKNRRKKEEQAKKGKEKGKGKGGGKAGKVARGLVGDRTPPEVAIMGVLVVLLKMMFGLDGRDRLPVNDQDPATAMTNGQAWLDALSDLDRKRTTEPDVRTLARGDFDILSLSPTSIDAYLALCTPILSTGLPPPKSSSLLQSYAAPSSPSPPPPPPLSPSSFAPPSAHLPSLPHAQDFPSPLDTLPPAPRQPLFGRGEDGEPPHRFPTFLLPGEAYAVYDRFDVMGEYPEVLQSVLREAGRIVGVGERELGVLVGRLEERLLRGREKERLAGQDKGKGKATSGGDDRGRSGASSGGLSKVKGKEKEVDAGVEDEAHGMEMMNEVE